MYFSFAGEVIKHHDPKVFMGKGVHFSFWLQRVKIISLRRVLAVNGVMDTGTGRNWRHCYILNLKHKAQRTNDFGESHVYILSGTIPPKLPEYCYPLGIKVLNARDAGGRLSFPE